MKCAACGHEARGKFCGKCGARIDASPRNEENQDRFAVIEPDKPAVPAPEQAPPQAAMEAPEPIIEEVLEPIQQETVEQESVEQEPVEQEPVEQVPVEQEPPPAAAPIPAMVHATVTPAKTSLRAWSLSFAAAAALFGLLAAGIAGTFTVLAKRSAFLQEMLYRLLKASFGISPEQAVSFSGQLAHSWRLQMILLSGGRFSGSYTARQSGQEPIAAAFSIHFPLLFHLGVLLLLAILFGYGSRKLVRRYSGTEVGRLGWVVAFGLTYAIMATIAISFLHSKPKLAFGSDIYTLDLHAEPIGTFVYAFLVSAIGMAIGIGGWKLLLSTQWGSWLLSFRGFAAVLAGSYALVFALMAIGWSLVSPDRLYNPNLTTMSSVWQMYNKDPASYAVVPNVLLQEQIYALGGTWEIGGPRSAQLLQADSPLKISEWGGLSADSAEGWVEVGETNGDASDRTFQLSSDLRWNWFSFALLLSYLYALTRIRIRSAAVYGVSVIGAILALAASAAYFSVGIRYGEEAAERIGFDGLQSGLAIGLITVLFLTLSFAVQRVIGRRKEGPAHAE